MDSQFWDIVECMNIESLLEETPCGRQFLGYKKIKQVLREGAYSSTYKL